MLIIIRSVKLIRIIQWKQIAFNLRKINLKHIAIKIHENYLYRKNLSTGVWISKYNRVILTKIKGKFIHSMGYTSSLTINNHSNAGINAKSVIMYPEEALYSLENVADLTS